MKLRKAAMAMALFLLALQGGCGNKSSSYQGGADIPSSNAAIGDPMPDITENAEAGVSSSQEEAAAVLPSSDPVPTEAPSITPTAVPSSAPDASSMPETTAPSSLATGSRQETGQTSSQTSFSADRQYVDVTSPVMKITLFNGDVITGPVYSLKSYFTLFIFDDLSLNSLTRLTQTREGEFAHYETDDPFCQSIDWPIDHSSVLIEGNTYASNDEDQSFSINTEDGVRLISLLNVREISVGDSETMHVPKEEDYERPAFSVQPGDSVDFLPQGTALLYLKDGTVYTSYPGAFPKFATANNYYYADEQPGYAQTRDFWMEEAKTVSFTDLSESENGSSDKIYDVTGELADGETIKKFITTNSDNEMRVFTREKGIIPLDFSQLDRIEVDMSVTPDFSSIKKVHITLSDGTQFSLPAHAMEYVHRESARFSGRPYNAYDYYFTVRSEDSEAEEGYSSKDVPFNTIKEVQFDDNDGNDPNKIGWPATLAYRDGSEERVFFRLTVSVYRMYYSPVRVALYCPYRIFYELDRDEFPLSTIVFD